MGRISRKSSISVCTLSAMPMAAPRLMIVCSSATCPNECAQGRKLQVTSSSSIGNIWCAALTLETKLPWLSTTPLGLAVVPEV